MPASDRRPTLRQIAASAGVSAMTVSRALRDDPRVKPAMREHLQKLATAVGYRPDPAITKLMGHLRQRSHSTLVASIAAITSVPEDAELHLLKQVREGARQRAESLGFRLELFRVTEPERTNRALQRTLLNRGIEGILLLPMASPTAMEQFLGWERFSVVSASPSVRLAGFPRVMADHYHNARLLANALTARGRRRTGFIGTETFALCTDHVFSATLAWQSLACEQAPVPPLLLSHHRDIRAALLPWLKRERPDSLLVHAEDLIPAVRDVLRSTQLNLPLVCTSVDPTAPACTGIDERHDLIGQKAVDLLTAALSRFEKGERTSYANTTVEGRLIEPRETPAT